ncbi:hypothetical protein ASC90_22170 [Rhizobium sp. Root1220]|nr:hypothetical protein ASC90_22170 [Rhizobium sp. Root1220]
MITVYSKLPASAINWYTVIVDHYVAFKPNSLLNGTIGVMGRVGRRSSTHSTNKPKLGLFKPMSWYSHRSSMDYLSYLLNEAGSWDFRKTTLIGAAGGTL